MINGKIRVGDKIVEKGRVYRIFKISTKKVKGEEKRVAHFRPYYKKDKYSSIISTIPVENIKSANIRRPVDKKTLTDIRKILSGNVYTKKADLKDLKEKFIENKIKETAKVVKYLWEEKQRRERLPPSKKKLFQNTMRSLAEEFAFASDRKLQKGKESVQRALSS